MAGKGAWNSARDKAQAEKMAKAMARAARNPVPPANQLIPGARARHDGWTEERTRIFLSTLAQTACVSDACHVAGMSTTSAYRHKRLRPEFAEAWEKALANANRGLVAIAYAHATKGKETIIMRKGQEVERRIEPSDALLSLLIKRSDAAGGEGAHAHKDLAHIPREEIITFAEWNQNIRFNLYNGQKFVHDEVRTKRRLDEDVGRLRRALENMAERGDQCPCCLRPLPENWPQQSLMMLDTMGLIEVQKVQEAALIAGLPDGSPEDALLAAQERAARVDD